MLGRESHPHFIQAMGMHKGALHAELHVPQGQAIPAKKMAAAENSQNPLERKRAALAKTLMGMHQG